MKLVLVFLCLVLAACSSEETSAPDAQPVSIDASSPDGTTARPANTVAGTIAYTGTASGDVIVALYTSLPAAGPPVGFTRLTAPVFPASFELTNVDEGTYQLMVVLDIGGDNPTMPGDEDIQVPSEPFPVTDEVGAWLDVTITDP